MNIFEKCDFYKRSRCPRSWENQTGRQMVWVLVSGYLWDFSTVRIIWSNSSSIFVFNWSFTNTGANQKKERKQASWRTACYCEVRSSLQRMNYKESNTSFKKEETSSRTRLEVARYLPWLAVLWGEKKRSMTVNILIWNYEVFNIWQGLIIHTQDVTPGQRKGKFMWQTTISLSSPCLSHEGFYISV